MDNTEELSRLSINRPLSLRAALDPRAPLIGAARALIVNARRIRGEENGRGKNIAWFAGELLPEIGGHADERASRGIG